MESAENSTLKLNELLDADQFDILQFDGLIKALKEQFNLKLANSIAGLNTHQFP